MIIQNSCILTIRPYDSKANTIYEFLGDYWHGNPVKYDKNNTNEKCKKTFGELYKNTFIRLNKLKDSGYVVKYIWEYDWILFKNKLDNCPKIINL